MISLIVMLSVEIFTKRSFSEIGGGSSCFDYYSRDLTTRILILFMVVLGYVVPNFVIIWAYISVYFVVKLRRTSQTLNINAKAAESLVGKEMSLVRKIVTKLVLFNVAWIPYVVIIMTLQFGDKENIHFWVTPVTVSLISFISKLSVLFISVSYAYYNFRSSSIENKLINEKRLQRVGSNAQQKNSNASHVDINVLYKN
jgi:hypothetical protein